MPGKHAKNGSGGVALSLHANNINCINWNLNVDNNMKGLMVEVCSG